MIHTCHDPQEDEAQGCVMGLGDELDESKDRKIKRERMGGNSEDQITSK